MFHDSLRNIARKILAIFVPCDLEDPICTIDINANVNEWNVKCRMRKCRACPVKYSEPDVSTPYRPSMKSVLGCM